MKNIMTFSTIVAVHVVAFVMIAVQPACTSNRGTHKAPSKRNQERVAYNENTEVIIPNAELAEGSSNLRTAPSRPAWTLDNKKNNGKVIVNEENQAPTSSSLLLPTKFDDEVAINESELPKTYTVVAGDNLSKIAVANKTSVAEIKSLNGLKSDVVKVGQKLMLPTPKIAIKSVEQSPASEDSESASIYTVARGDTLSKIAVANKTTIAAIKETNKLKNDNIYVGQKLRLPSPSTSTGSTTKNNIPSNYDTYTVKRGDTLGEIALAHQISLAKIKKLNPSVNPNKLQVGQVLIINEKEIAPIVIQDKPAATPKKAEPTTAPVIIKDEAKAPESIAPQETPAPSLSPAVKEAPVAPVVAPEPVVEDEITVIEL